ncbi:MAG: glycosyltransferase family 2 protein [Nitrospirota bacterium]
MKPDPNNILLTVVMPSLNEEKNIVAAVENTLKAFEDFNIKGEIIIINDGSSDNTENLANNMILKNLHVRMFKHETPKGIGASFWDGVDNAYGDIVVMLPGDNENDPWEIFRYYKLLEHVDIVIPFVYNRGVRALFRNMLSYLYRFIINATFWVNFNYTNGTILYRKSILKELDYRSGSFFFQTDILIRTVKKGYLFAEVPYKIDLRKKGISKAVTFPSLLRVMRGYLRLVRDQYFRKNLKNNVTFTQDSLTALRRYEDKDKIGEPRYK